MVIIQAVVFLASIAPHFYMGLHIAEFIMTATYAFGYLYLTAVLTQFILAILACRERLILIKKGLAKKSFLNPVEVQMYVDILSEIFKILKRINEYLTFPLILAFFALLLDFTFEFYGILRIFYKNTPYFSLALFNGVMWCVYEIYPVILTIYCAESTWRVIEDIKNIGMEFLYKGKILDFNSERIFEYFFRSINKPKLQASTAFFNIEWKLLFEVE